MRQDFRISTHETLGGHRASSRFWRHLTILVATVALGMAALAFSASIAPSARAAGGDAIVHWDSRMIYAGHNNGFPYGPVGEHAIIHGENFGSYTSQTVKLKLISGDINNPPSGSSASEMCTNASNKVSIGTVGVDSSGNFDYNFDWPSGANHGQYSVCVYDSTDAPTANFDDGPFSVLSAGRPSISLNRTTVAAGSTVTVTGKNWVPPQGVQVLIGPCMFCDAQTIASKTVTSSGLNSGSFSVTLTIPEGTSPGQYSVGAFSENGILDMGTSGVKKLTVTPPATPTPNPTATTSTLVGAGGNNGTDTGQNDNTVLLVAVVAGLIVLLFIVMVVALVLLLRRRKPDQQPGPPGVPGGYPAGGYPPQGYVQSGYPPQSGYPQPNYPQPGYPPQGYTDPNAPTVGVGIPYVTPTPQTPQPNWGTPPQTPPPNQPQVYPMRDDSPTRPSSFPPDADTFPPS